MEHRAMIPFRAVAATATTTFLLCAVALAATPHPGHFTGKTSSANRPRAMTFRVAANKIRGMEISYELNCGGARVGTQPDSVIGTFVIRGGRFSGTRHLASADSTATVTGRFTTPRKASGTVRLHITITGEGEEGGPDQHCDSGTLRWSAHLG
jgi:hypothetical protein